ncbi:MAG: hypothetical protein Q8865_06470, partial [Bacillota bacterium]|nr:hypothetical protein [Bacillota bacterium]
SQISGTEYYYDNDGNLIVQSDYSESGNSDASVSPALSDSSNDVVRYEYNTRGNMTKYKKGSTTASYTYNGDGLCTQKTVGSNTTKYLYDTGNNITLEKSEIKAENLTLKNAIGIANSLGLKPEDLIKLI